MTLLGLIVRWEDMARALNEPDTEGSNADVRFAVATTLNENATALRAIVGLEREPESTAPTSEVPQ
jgi:hypothetical protein